MKVYCAGPITKLLREGYTPDEVRQRFNDAAEKVRLLGHEPVTPPDLQSFEKSWADCMRKDLKILADCDGIYLMRGWQESRGATLERMIAKALGMEEMYE